MAGLMTRSCEPNPSEVFTEAMEACGPFEPCPRLAVAVSGGGDSMGLALLTKAWLEPRQGSLVALVIDHALRPDSAAEAELTAARLASLGIPVTQRRLTELWPGTALAERARIARYEALSTLCAEAGIPHLLLGHHAADQAETVLMRGLRSSGPAGLAAMPLVTEHRAVRLIRPLLKIPPGWLRTMLQEAGVGWVEDPSNTNRNALRARLRARRADSAGTGAATTALVEAARACGGTRARHEAQIAQDLAAHAELRPEGFAVLRPGPVRADTLAALLQAVAGAAYPPSASQLTNVARTLEPGTLAGVRIMPAGRVGPGMLFVREAAAMAAPVPALPGATWDSRFRLSLIGAEFSDPRKTPMLGPVGDDAARLRSWSELPAAVLRTLPALRDKGGLAVVPHLEYPDPRVCEQVRVAFAPARAAAAAPFFTQ